MLRTLVNVFNKYPLAAPIVSAGKLNELREISIKSFIGLLSIVGDTIAQHVLEKKPWNRHDHSRTARLTLYGFLVIVKIIFSFYYLNF